MILHGYIIPVSGSGCGPLDGARAVSELYRNHGDSFVDHIEGAFAIAIWDSHENRLLLCTDRLGLRPIYYTSDGRGLRFASEIKALLVDPQQRRDLDMDGLASFLLLGLPYGDLTLFDSVSLVPAGSLMSWQGGAPSTVQYWSLQYPERRSQLSMAEAVDRVHGALDDAVARMLAPELDFGIMLSGGLDSRWLAGAIGKRRSDVVAYTFGGEDTDDCRVARQVADQLGFRHVQQDLSPDYLERCSEDITYITDGLYNVINGHEFPLVSSMSGEADVVTGGFLGDLLFGRNVNPKTLLVGGGQAAIDHAYEAVRQKNITDRDLDLLFDEDVAADLKARAQEIFAASYEDYTRGIDCLDHQHIATRHRRWYYASQLLKSPYVEMCHPFHDSNVIEAGLELSTTQRFLQRAYRKAFAKYHEDLARIPWTLTSLKASGSTPSMLIQRALSRSVGRVLPSSVSDRVPLLRLQKKPTDYPGWIRGPLKQYVESMLIDSEVGPAGLLRKGAVASLVGEHMSGHRNLENSLGLLLTFRHWYQLFGSRDPVSRRPVSSRLTWASKKRQIK